MMIPDPDHVVRYVRPRLVLEDGSVEGSAFRLRSGDSGLSVNWLDWFQGLSKSQQIEQVRIRSRLEMRRNGRLAELNVGRTRQSIGSLASLRFVHVPLPAEDGDDADPSHSEITGLPSDSSVAARVGDLIAWSVTNLYPAVDS